MFETLGVDGCIIVPTPGMETEIAAMIQRGKHIVLFDKTFGSKLAADRVVINNRQSMYQAVEHLVERGFENIGLVAITVEEAKNEERIIGYKRAISQHKMVSYAYALPFKTRYADYVKAIRKILRDNKKLDAIIFGTNYLGVAGLEAIRQMKLTIPKDLAVVVFDDHDLFRIHQPAISVISQPIVEIAQAVIDTLLSKLHKGPGKKKAQTITLSTSLIIRQSS